MHHEPKPNNEVFLGNTDGITVPPYLSSLKTIRVGSIAYDIHGAILPTDMYRPLFLARSEEAIYDTLMRDVSKAIRGWSY